MSNEMKLRVWGVRGSYPTPGAGTVKIHIEQAERDVILAVLGAGDIADLVGASRKRMQRGESQSRMGRGWQGIAGNTSLS